MRQPDGFDARRLRPHAPRHLGWRLLAGCAALIATLGILLAMAGSATLLGRPPALGPLNDSTGAALTLLVSGLLLLAFGVGLWRHARRRFRRRSNLDLSPRLMKKRH
ncbi:hypothetical protein FBY21_0610 [Pseudomonas sp. SLBN-26]|uniref:LPXTG-motif cell wall anchor domain-containing protein n=1 Tax=Metapseudomonas otitidis TaxID=319939 RepID=A0A679GDZ5_9GAMM|nr:MULTISPECIES: hypothetical protein [Pseudomonas]KIV75584.1 hypothetical protein SZ55_0170 [Pseudomonas sp. FeS53a]MCO7554457.1 hypothetical protein [Pseudomonas otitidis]MCP1616002.1 putative membrane protein [Pseudomonas otitidis]MDG9779995.1 hypothetical protein [Pseudomonas otitidis]MDH1106058.1 hypothetical protein [Pseudomonas otitidis]